MAAIVQNSGGNQNIQTLMQKQHVWGKYRWRVPYIDEYIWQDLYSEGERIIKCLNSNSSNLSTERNKYTITVKTSNNVIITNGKLVLDNPQSSSITLNNLTNNTFTVINKYFTVNISYSGSSYPPEYDSFSRYSGTIKYNNETIFYGKEQTQIGKSSYYNIEIKNGFYLLYEPILTNELIGFEYSTNINKYSSSNISYIDNSNYYLVYQGMTDMVLPLTEKRFDKKIEYGQYIGSGTSPIEGSISSGGNSAKLDGNATQLYFYKKPERIIIFNNNNNIIESASGDMQETMQHYYDTINIPYSTDDQIYYFAKLPFNIANSGVEAKMTAHWEEINNNIYSLSLYQSYSNDDGENPEAQYNKANQIYEYIVIYEI